MPKAYAALWVLPLLAACRDEASPPGLGAAPASAFVDPDVPDGCKPCHAAIVAEWSTSQHAAAHDDPIFLAMRTMRAGREGDKVAEQCVSCHAPRVATRGVTCAACHSQPGEAARFAGPRDLAPGVTPAHATGPASVEIKDGSALCMRCHAQLTTPAGVSVCTTGVEWTGHAGKDSCAACHMPLTPGPGTTGVTRAEHPSHRFLGPHLRWTKEASGALVPVELALSFEGTTLAVSLTNKGGHDFPTGFPARMAVLELVGHDAGGAEVWRNFAKNPLAEAPDAVLNKVYVDDKGEPTIAPWSTKLTRDTRLRPAEARVLRVEVPPAVTRVSARLLLRLLPPTLAEKLGLGKDDLATARPVAAASATRND
jgi:hypothetical protein